MTDDRDDPKVVELEFATWTSDGILRHASFEGLREDKDSASVTRAVSGKPPELWQVPLFWLRDRGRIGSVGVRCNACGHSKSWPIAELISRYGPQTLVSDLWRRWRCSRCGSRDVVPFSVGR